MDIKALEDAEYKARHEADALKHQLDIWAKDYTGSNSRSDVRELVKKLGQQNQTIEKLKMTLEVLRPVRITCLIPSELVNIAGTHHHLCIV